MKLIRSSFFLLCVFVGGLVHAKELANRLGVGFRDSVSMDIPSVAAFYYPNSDYGMIGSIGIDTQKNQSKSAIAGAVRRIIFKEEQMNFFGGAQLALLSQEVPNTTVSGFETQSGIEVAATVGGEFFFQGLESLGFNFETGVAMANVGRVRFRTIGDSFLRAGIAFYF